MRHILFKIGPLEIAGYGTMIALGFILALIMGEKRAKKKEMRDDLIFGLAFTCIIFGILGAKLMHYITDLKYYLEDPSRFLNIGSGFVVYGGIILGVLAGYIYCRHYKLVFSEYFDLVMPSVALAQAFGRIGCFLAGCCYGKETDSAIGVVFKDSPFAPNGVKLIPSQLISSLMLFVLVFILVRYADKTWRRPFKVAGLYMILYSIGRFFIEFFRGDEERGNIGFLSTSQFISIFILIGGIVLFNLHSMMSRKKYSPYGEEEDVVERKEVSGEKTMEESTVEEVVEEITE